MRGVRPAIRQIRVGPRLRRGRGDARTIRIVETVALREIRRGIRDLGLVGCSVCVHASLRSFGWVEGGAETVVEAFLGERCTLLVPAFSWAFRAASPVGRQPPRNGFDYEASLENADDGRIYRTSTVEIDRSMGVIARAVVERPGRSRGAHPLNSFAAVGSEAETLVGTQAPLDVYAPLTMLADRGGFVLLIGVGLTSMTLLHLAEARAGREPFRRWATALNGEVIEVQAGSCSDGFGAFKSVLASLERETSVGASRWRVYPARETLAAAVGAIRENPQMTHCGDPGCARCRDAIAGGPFVSA